MKNIKYILPVLLTVLFACSSDSGGDNVVSPGLSEPSPLSETLKWVISNTDNSHNVAIPVTANLKFGDRNFVSGDKIGVFFKENGEYKCAGFTTWTGKENVQVTVWGDDNSTSSIKEGLKPGEVLKWFVRVNSTGKDYQAEVTYSQGPGNYTVNGLSVINSISVK